MSEQRLLGILIIAICMVAAPGAWLLGPLAGVNERQLCGLEFVLILAGIGALVGICIDVLRSGR
jgi:hypothetical protein